MPTAQLPDWLTPVANRKDCYAIDADLLYPRMLAELAEQHEDCDPERPDQYWLECVKQFAKLDAQMAVKTAGLRKGNPVIEFRIRGDKTKWNRKNHPLGKRREHILTKLENNTKAADRRTARESRMHYKQLRGFLPA